VRACLHGVSVHGTGLVDACTCWSDGLGLGVGMLNAPAGRMQKMIRRVTSSRLHDINIFSKPRYFEIILLLLVFKDALCRTNE
jgi:hypothetical protein